MVKNRLSYRIQPNDEITLKQNLYNYVKNINNRSNCINIRFTRSGCCKDPDYVAEYKDLLNFSGKSVVIIYVSIKTRIDKHGNYINSFYYVTVMDRTGNICEFPIEFIDKSHCLRRDHKRISLHNKFLIC